MKLMKRALAIAIALISAPLAEAQVTTYCKDIGNGKTYCTGGTVVHRFDQGVVVTNPVPQQPYPQAMPPNPLLQNNALPTLNAPYTGAGAQNSPSPLRLRRWWCNRFSRPYPRRPSSLSRPPAAAASATSSVTRSSATDAG